MQGFHNIKFDSNDIEAILQRLREALGYASNEQVCKALGFENLECLMERAMHRVSQRFLNAVFDICAEHGLSRLHILRGEGPQTIVDV